MDFKIGNKVQAIRHGSNFRSIQYRKRYEERLNWDYAAGEIGTVIGFNNSPRSLNIEFPFGIRQGCDGDNFIRIDSIDSWFYEGVNQ